MTARHAHSPALQSAIEAHTHALFETPEVQAARHEGERALKAAIPDADAASLDRFPAIAHEITLNALIGLADGYTGVDLPRLIMRPPRPSQDGGTLPGNRGLHDNPDTFYRLIPLSADSNFVLEGKVGDHPATIFELSALTSKWQTLCNLSRSDLAVEAGGTFRIHFGPEPGPDADHFVRSAPDAEMLLLRETLAHPAKERPCTLTITNHVDRGGAREKDDASQVAAAAARVAKWFREAIRLTELPLSQAPNEFPAPLISGEHGKLVTMAYSIGHFWVRPDEALVLTIDPGSAAYTVAPITNLWGTTNRNLSAGASLNDQQAHRDADGRFTCVLSLSDPGITNWLDPDGLERGFLFLRWAGLDPEQAPDRPPRLEARCVRLADLESVLPAETPRLTPQERAHQRAQQAHDHSLRFEEFPLDP